MRALGKYLWRFVLENRAGCTWGMPGLGLGAEQGWPGPLTVLGELSGLAEGGPGAPSAQAVMGTAVGR